jgi:hypothetical protein
MTMRRPLKSMLLIGCVCALPVAAAAKPARKRPAGKSAPAASTSGAPAAASSGTAAASDEGASGDNADERTIGDSSGPADAAAKPAAAEPPPPSKPAPAKEAAAAPPPPPAPPPAPSGDLVKLRADYDRLRDELFRARARSQAVQEGLYQSRLGATLRWKGAPAYAIRRAELRLDGGSIWDSGDKPLADNLIKVADRPVKPGQHALTVRIEIHPVKKNAQAEGSSGGELGYVSEHTFAIIVPDGKHTTAVLTGDEDGDPPEYEPEMELELEQEK